jgi:hypothetical protein
VGARERRRLEATQPAPAKIPWDEVLRPMNELWESYARSILPAEGIASTPQELAECTSVMDLTGALLTGTLVSVCVCFCMFACLMSLCHCVCVCVCLCVCVFVCLMSLCMYVLVSVGLVSLYGMASVCLCVFVCCCTRKGKT